VKLQAVPPIYLYSRSEVLNAWVYGTDPSLDESLMYAVNMKDESFNPALHVPAFKKLVDTQEITKNKGAKLTTMEENLLVEQYDLLLCCISHHICMYTLHLVVFCSLLYSCDYQSGLLVN